MLSGADVPFNRVPFFARTRIVGEVWAQSATYRFVSRGCRPLETVWLTRLTRSGNPWGMNEPLLQLRRRTFGASLATMKLPFRRCYYPEDACNCEAIRAHSVQNARMLELLQEEGHVITPKLDVSLHGGPRTSFERVGRNQATTFHGLCAEHDTAIFAPIENVAIDLDSEEHKFLLSYRAVIKEAHATSKAARDTQVGYQTGVESGLFPAESCAPGMLAVEHMSLAYMTHMHKVNYDAIYKSRRWDGLEHYVRDLGVPASLAVNSLLSTGHYSTHTDSLAYATLNVFPHNGTTMLVCSYLADHRRQFNRSFKRFIESGDPLRKLSYLVLKRCENFVLVPSLFAAFTTEQKEECLRFFERNIGGQEYEPENEGLIYLFAPVVS